MKNKYNYITVVFLLMTMSIFSQNEDNKWTFGLDLASVKYSDADGKTIGGSFINQSPRISLAKYMFYNITFVGSFSTAIGDTQKYTTFDGLVRYDFGTSQNNVVPYVFIGGSFIKAAVLTPTANFGAGNTFWFSDKYGLNLQMMYKFSEDKFSSQKPHFMTSIGLVYSFGKRSLNPRLWSSKH
ncbi:hypothetical protein [Polaribacter sp. Hel1_85]|uniref:hypothetical protein n=1 Tax=Polaribacter sp. Hel1_85 TaxID=1250005 RepID=UPI0012E06046|nr:hypothetical protein [Polaribacter sp. Hel1_85]